MTGLVHSRGDLVFLIDSDLEEDPELLAAFADTLGKARPTSSTECSANGKEASSSVGAEGCSTRFSICSRTTRFRKTSLRSALMTRRYVSALVAHGERETMIDGLWALTGFRQVPLEVTKHARSATTYSFRHKFALLVNSITSFSSKPLEFIFYLGLVIWCVASGAAAYLIARRLFFGELLPGWPSLIVSVWLLGGLILACLGVIGIYLSKIFIETKQRPYTIVRHVYERTPTQCIRRCSRQSRAVALKKLRASGDVAAHPLQPPVHNRTGVRIHRGRHGPRASGGRRCLLGAVPGMARGADRLREGAPDTFLHRRTRDGGVAHGHRAGRRGGDALVHLRVGGQRARAQGRDTRLRRHPSRHAEHR